MEHIPSKQPSSNITYPKCPLLGLRLELSGCFWNNCQCHALLNPFFSRFLLEDFIYFICIVFLWLCTEHLIGDCIGTLGKKGGSNLCYLNMSSCNADGVVLNAPVPLLGMNTHWHWNYFALCMSSSCLFRYLLRTIAPLSEPESNTWHQILWTLDIELVFRMCIWCISGLSWTKSRNLCYQWYSEVLTRGVYSAMIYKKTIL